MSQSQSQSQSRPIITIVECLSVFAGGSILGFLIAQAVGIPLSNPLTVLVEQPDTPLGPLAWRLAQVLFWQYLGWMICVGLMGLLRPRAGTRARSLGTDSNWRSMSEFTLLLSALCVLPSVALTQAQQIWNFGERAPWFDALQQRPWDWQFWLFAAVGSYALIPVLEEWFFRGYLFRTLARYWNPLAAALLSASLFAFSHTQYLQLDPFNLSMLVNLLYLGAVLALATAYSGSLIPAIVAHAVINLPMSPVAAGVVLATAVLVVVRGRVELHGFGSFISAQLGHTGMMLIVGSILIGATYGLVSQQLGSMLAIGALPVLFALCLYYFIKRIAGARGSNFGGDQG